MKKIIFCMGLAALLLLGGCRKSIVVSVGNSLDCRRDAETVEISSYNLKEQLGISDVSQLVILDKDKKQVPYQFTHDEKLIFQVSLGPNEVTSYVIRKGKDTLNLKSRVYGRQVKECLDDFAWENDKIAYRVFGPARELNGEIFTGINVWVKDTPGMVVDTYYKQEAQKDAAAGEHQSGRGFVQMDNALGCGAMAPFIDGNFVMSRNYTEAKILDNGPIRLSVEFRYAPVDFGTGQMTETRIVSLDAGSLMNHIREDYVLAKPCKTAAGLPVYEEGSLCLDHEHGYVAVANAGSPESGQLYMGLVFVAQNAVSTVRQNQAMALLPFVPQRGGVDYYAGAGASRAGFADFEAWKQYVADFARKLNTPIEVMVRVK